MFGLHAKNKDPNQDHDKNDLEQFFEDEDWDIGQKGGEVTKGNDIDWSNYDFMQTFDDVPHADHNSSTDDNQNTS